MYRDVRSVPETGPRLLIGFSGLFHPSIVAYPGLHGGDEGEVLCLHYELSGRAGKLGTPERPLSDLDRLTSALPFLVDAFGDIAYHTRSETETPSNSGVKHRTVRCGLEDIAHATHLRPDDIALALREAGLLTHRRSAQSNPTEPAGEAADNNRHMTSENAPNGAQDTKHQSEVQIVITHEMIERVA
ncbi:unnamed protein product, partial [Rhizoctonia solani]